MKALLFYVLVGIFTALGAAFALKGRAVRDWLVRIYDNPAITNHLSMPGFLLSLRVVGFGWLVFGLIVIGSAIYSRISN